ncbi:hypothetical protein FSPOR_8977 [Fusarium sporotrichioides]|uniref:Heterokaryon incompatibility domain-containing protein n=1 Tax=Fusarium sporotrichioides TaxID=5514 RepID=A0A395RSD6_FUSSP|nr:hypothetical protein FSPOR_8977 [Fusarium sporotrichioides]
MLSSDNLNELRNEIKLSELPASFRDAIITRRHLDVPYIWIDSLCILQMGPTAEQDWLHHAEEMHRVYEHYLLNISIDVSEDPHQGAFRARNPFCLQDCYVWTPFPLFPETVEPHPSHSGFFVKEDETSKVSALDAEHIRTRNESPEPTAQQNLRAIFTRQDFFDVRYELPINGRAWVLQERFLSHRTLHFCADRITWECNCKDTRGNMRSKTMSEYLPDGFDDITGNFDCWYQEDYSITNVSTLSKYYELVMYYAGRQLTFPDKDKLVAFASIARRCTSWMGNDYCAGLSRSIIPQGLLWRISGEWSVRRPATYRAPSWSWASVDSPLLCPLMSSDGVTLAEVQDMTVELVDQHNRFGQVKSASLAITGPLIASKLIDAKLLVEVTLEVPTHVQTMPETKEEMNEMLSRDDVFFFAILKDSQHPDGKLTLGIVLKIDTNGHYCRIELWEAKEGFMSQKGIDGTSFKTRTVTIL